MTFNCVLSVKVWTALYFVVCCCQVKGFTYGDCTLHDPEHYGGRTKFFCYRKQLLQVPKNIPLEINDIDISNNFIKVIYSGDFQNLAYLGTLNISHNSISKVESDAFKDLISLTELNLSINRLKALPKELFSGLTNLKTLLLERNQISMIDNSMFSNLPQLEDLKLSNNMLSNIKEIQHIFRMPLLKELHIGSNNISVFQSAYILNSSNLIMLNLSGNPLYRFNIDSDIFPRLKEIDISRCFSDENFDWYVSNKTLLPKVKTLHMALDNISAKHINTIFQTFNRSLSSVTLTAVPAVKKLLSSVCQIPTLTELKMRDNNFTNFNTTGLEKCSLLNVLDLRYNRLTTWGNDLASLKTLSTLELGNNKFFNISKILELSMLEELNLEYNQIDEFKCKAFKNLNKLKSLQLYQNKIYKTEPCDFQGLTSLKYLSLGTNRISSLKGLFKNGPANLEILGLASNGLVTLTPDDFVGLKSLKVLQLHENKIHSIKPNTFHALGNLKVLNLRANKLGNKMLRPSIFAGLTNLSELSLQSNYLLRDVSLKKIPFINLKSLQWLSVYSQMHHAVDLFLPSNFLSNLTNLKSFWAQNLGLTSLPSDLFNDTQQLTQLALSGNDLTSLSADLFLPIPKLAFLYLKDSRLKSLDFLIGAELQNLYYLSILNNQITSINDTMMKSVPELQVLDMQGNTFVCDCSNAWLINWIEEDNFTQVFQANRFECNSPPNLKETKTKLLDVDMHACSVDVEFYCYILTASLVLLTTIIPLVYHFLRWQIVYAYYLLLAYIYDKKQGVGRSQRFMYDAFISYNRNDELWVTNELLPKLEGEQGWRLCLHHRDFQPGKPIVDNIVDGIYGSRKTICVISRHYLESEWCSREVQVASFRLFDEKKDVLILVFLEDIPVYQLSPYHRLRSLVKKKTFLSWPRAGQDTRVFWEKLRLALSARQQSERGHPSTD